MSAQSLLELQRLLMVGGGLFKEHAVAPSARKLNETLRDLLNHVKNIGQDGDLSQIVATEKAIIEDELTHHANSKSMVASLNAALAELTAIERLLAIVDDRHEYNRIDQAHLLPRNREKGLPLDEARQAFRSHHARLGNLEKARLSGDEKAIIEARKDNMLIANRHYAQRQARTLGIPEV